jgi:hypothetical protein
VRVKRRLFSLAPFLLVAIACKGEGDKSASSNRLAAGAPCNVAMKPSCNGTTGYVCDVLGGSTVQEVQCKGPKGCKVVAAKLDCDFSANAAGEACPFTDDAQAMCATETKQKVACRDRKIALEECRGPKGCYIENNATHCDHSVAQEGDPCGSDVVGVGGGYSCSMDKKDSLQCKAGKYVLDAHCRGPKGCEPGSETPDQKLHCDSSIQLDGDPCDVGQLLHYSCAADGKSLLQCDGKVWKKDEACTGNKKCQRVDNKVGCR